MTVVILGTAALVPGAVAGTWGSPATDLSGAGRDASIPQIAADAQGSVTAVWQRWEGGTSTIQAARYAGGAWGGTADISVGGQSAAAPQVAVDPQGSATAVWQRSNGVNSIVQAARYSGGAWGVPANLSATLQNAGVAQITVDPQGRVTAIWERNNGIRFVVQVARYSDGVWSAASGLSNEAQDALDPQIAADAQGVVTAVWRRWDGTTSTIQASRYSGGGWSDPVNLSAAGRDAVGVQIATDPQGAATAVWVRENDAGDDIVQASRYSGGGWSAPVNLSAAGRDATGPQVTADPHGIATVVWYRGNEAGNSIVQASRYSGDGWGPPAGLSAVGRNAGDAQIAADTQGVATAVWVRVNDARNVIVQASRYSGGRWGAPADLSAVGRNATTPQVTVDPTGAVTTVWGRGNGLNTIIQALRYLSEPSAPRDPVATAGVEQASVSWSAPTMDGGSAVTAYTVTASPGGATCSATAPTTSCTVHGLTGGTAHTFTVTATNGVGTSMPSAPSAAVTPLRAVSLTVTLQASRTRITSGRPMTITIRTASTGTKAATAVRACLPLPRGLTVVRTGGASRKGRTLCFALRTVPARAHRTGTVTVRADVVRAAVTRTITARVTSGNAPTATATARTVRIRPGG